MASKFFKILLLLAIPVFFAFQWTWDSRDTQILLDKYDLVQSNQSAAEKTLFLAESFKGAPYVGGTLDKKEIEEVVVNLREFDCWTLVESCLGITRLDADIEGGLTKAFSTEVQKMRYRSGIVDGYGARIHYFSEWLMQAEKNGIIHDKTAELGGVPYKKTIAFMSNHPQFYPKMKNEKTKKAIEAAEKSIQAHPFFYIPKAQVRRIEKQIEDGDIIAITASKKDLDVSHEGFACWHNGRLHLLHASSDKKKVVMTQVPLHDYLAKNKSQSGIMVARIVD